ncbi:MAG: hypothetical protein JNK57_18115 [Planctomycetaceae bacterium]|nr:hypothetical protein [Planctomycetaceae bacterium]
MKRNSTHLRLPWIWLLLCLVMAPATGCQLFQPREKLTPVPAVFDSQPQVGDLFTTVNRRTQNVRQLQAETTVGISGVPAKLSGSLLVERPNRLRLKVSPLGMDSLGADIGSNEQQFWVWVKSGGVMAESVLMFANHQEYAQSQVATVMPLEPRWITDALGLITFESTGQYQGPVTRSDGRLEIRGQEPTSRGMQASTMVFDPKTGLLKQKALYDSQGQLIGYCDIGEYQYFPEVDAAIPTSMTLNFRPGTDIASTATIQLSNIRLNGLYVDSNTAWSMPNPVGIQRVDLSRTPITPLPTQTSMATKQVSHTAENESYLPFRGKWLTR